MKVLSQIARDPARGVLVVTHDPRILPFADRIVRIRLLDERNDGRRHGDRVARRDAFERCETFGWRKPGVHELLRSAQSLGVGSHGISLSWCPNHMRKQPVETRL